jgi:hypothetical protein
VSPGVEGCPLRRNGASPRFALAAGVGDGVQINVPSDARMRSTDKVDRRAEEVSAFFK